MRKAISKRIAALVMAVMMIVGMLPATALATTVSTIDYGRTGKIEIIKEIPETTTDENGQDVTSYERIGDVVFHYWKVADIEQVTLNDTVQIMYKVAKSSPFQTYLTGKSVSAAHSDTNNNYYAAATLQAVVAADYAGLKPLAVANGNAMDATSSAEDATKGITTKDGLALGLYLIVETGYPATIKQPCNPFLISLPSNVTANGGHNGDETDYTYYTNEWTYEVTAIPKNESQSIKVDKSIIVDRNDEDTPKDDEVTQIEDYQIGDTVPFRITADVPSSIALLKKYYLADALSAGLTLKTDSFVVWGEKENGTVVKLTVDTEYTLDFSPSSMVEPQDGGTALAASFVVNFVPDTLGEYVKVYVDYETTLNQNAAIYKAGNPNEVVLEYSKVTGTGEEGDEVATVKPTLPRPIVYTYDVMITKTLSESATGTVKFALTDNQGNPVNVSRKQDEDGNDIPGEYVVDPSGSNIVELDFASAASATVEIIGLNDGQYFLTETQTISGFTLLKEAIVINIRSTFTGEKYVADTAVNYGPGEYFKYEAGKTYYNEAGKLIDLSGITASTAEKPVYVKIDGVVHEGSASGNEVTKYHRLSENNVHTAIESNYAVDSDGIIHFTVANKKGFDLPTTGGMGTYIFTIGGILIIAAAALLLINKKRRV